MGAHCEKEREMEVENGCGLRCWLIMAEEGLRVKAGRRKDKRREMLVWWSLASV